MYNVYEYYPLRRSEMPTVIWPDDIVRMTPKQYGQAKLNRKSK